MASHSDRKEWGKPGINKDNLEEYWKNLLKKVKRNRKEEIAFFYHCTSVKAKSDIDESGVVTGSYTDFPALAPLASYKGLTGTWFVLSSTSLPNKSPYGTQRLLIRANDLMTYLSTEEKEPEIYDHENRWDASDSDDGIERFRGGKNRPAKQNSTKKKKQRPINKKQNECYLKHKLPPPEEEVILTDPQLFFECAHYYGNTQYVRLLLVRAADPLAVWCEEMCKEISLLDNPFLEYQDGRIWTKRAGGPTSQSDVIVEVLIVGSIDLTKLPRRAEWDKVSSNIRRAGVDPEIGVGWSGK